MQRSGKGAVLTLPAAYVAEHVELAYATTAFRGQGSTVDTALADAIAGKEPGDLVFTSPGGSVQRVQSFRRRVFNRAATAVGVSGLTPHELRHTSASLAIAAGASIKGVQSMLGHASATLTLDRYGHLFGDERDVVAARLDVARAQALVPPLCPEARCAAGR